MATITGKVKNSVTLQGQVTVPMGIVPRGNVDLTTNGVHDVTSYETATVDMLVPSGSMEITENGTFDVAAFAELIANIPSGLTYETGAFTPIADTRDETIYFKEAHSEAPLLVIMCDTTATPHTAALSSVMWSVISSHLAFGQIPLTKTRTLYGIVTQTYQNGSTTTKESRELVYGPESGYKNNQDCTLYWVTEKMFRPARVSGNIYWRKGRTCRWIAIWAPTE